MMFKLNYLLWSLLGIIAIVNPSNAVTLKGNLPNPDDVVKEIFIVPKLIGNKASRVRIRSVSYGGGTLLASPTKAGGEIVKETIKAGGFDPILTVSDAAGITIAQADDVSVPGGTGTREDPNTSVIFDSAFDLMLEPGIYQLAITQYDNFNFLGRSKEIREEYPGYNDVTGAERNPQYAVEVITFKELIDNSVIVLNGTHDMSAIADFKLGKELDLDVYDVANFGGFDHFNWYQEIVEIKSPLPQPGEILRPPCRGKGTDPELGGNCIDGLMKIAAAINLTIDDILEFFGGDCTLPACQGIEDWLIYSAADDAPWYWNEGGAIDPELANKMLKSLFIENPSNTKVNSVKIDDAPGGFNVGTEIIFHTYLAGVEEDPTKGAVFAAPLYENTAFKWKFTQTHPQKGTVEELQGTVFEPFLQTFYGKTSQFYSPELGGRVEFLGFLDESDWLDAGPRLQNQFDVFGFNTDSTNAKVPEPSTILGLLTIGGIGLGASKKNQP